MLYGSPRVVSDVMTHTVVAVGRDAPFKDIVTLMQQWKVSALPVLAGEGRVIGVVSEPTCCPRRSSATATRTGSPRCAAWPTWPRPAD
ncbi:hypothetical protein RGQ21_15630 [Kitasatospora aureofaciens]|nr:hypothetical protein RGQ21_15630 [Kitasatospora aureofaciens]